MSQNKFIFKDEGGMPVLFSGRKRVLENDAGTELITPDSTSGPAEWGRYHDAVREAARSLDHPEEGDIKHFLNARARHPEKVDSTSFHEAVKRQRTADLVDIIDHHMRRSGSLPRGARMVRVQAPRGYIRRTLRKSSPEDLAHIKHRLVSIGHNPENADNFLGDHVDSDVWEQAAALEVRMSEEEFDGLTFDNANPIDDEIESVGHEDLIEALKSFKPEIHIHINREEI